MATQTAKDVKPSEAAPKPWTTVHGPAPGLVGISGRIRLQIGDTPVGLLQVDESGEVSIVTEGAAAAVAKLDNEQTLLELLAGELPPIVAILRGRLFVTGDGLLTLKVLFGMEAGSPWAMPREGAGSHAL